MSAPVEISTADRVADHVRAQFPVLEDCVYLNSNSTGAFPRAGARVLEEYWATLASWRDEVWEVWWPALHHYADSVAALLGAPAGSVVTDVNASSLLGRVATALDYDGSRCRVVTTDLEFPTIETIVRGCETLGAEMVSVPSIDGIAVDEALLHAAIDERTRLVCVSHATFVTGALLDLDALVRVAHDAGALVAVDAYQSVGTVPIDVTTSGVDFLVAGAHKWLCGAPDLGFMYVRPEVCRELRPRATGWVATAAPFRFEAQTELALGARRFASGTPAVLPALFSQPGLDLISEVGVSQIRMESLRRTSIVIVVADALGIPVATPREDKRRGGIVCLRPNDAAAHTAALVHRGFICSHRNGIRVAPHFYNTDEEVYLFMETLKELITGSRP